MKKKEKAEKALKITTVTLQIIYGPKENAKEIKKFLSKVDPGLRKNRHTTRTEWTWDTTETINKKYISKIEKGMKEYIGQRNPTKKQISYILTTKSKNLIN